MKKALSILLACMLLCGMAVGCGGGTPDRKTFTVSYECNGGRAKVSDLYVEGQLFSPMPPSVTTALTGYTFTGWYYDAECTDPYDYRAPKIHSDITLYAGWSNLHTVYFHTDTEERIESREVAYNDTIRLAELPSPAAKTIAGKAYAFDYWMNINTNERVRDDFTMTSLDVHLFAVYKTGLAQSFDISRRGEWVAKQANALTWASDAALDGYGDAEVEMTLMPGAGWAGIAFQISDEAKNYEQPFSQSDVSHYAFVILASPAGATQIVRRNAGSYDSCSTGWSVANAPLRNTHYAQKWAAYVASGDSMTFRLKVSVLKDEDGKDRVNGYIWDDIDEDWELVCFATADRRSSTGAVNAAPVQYVKKDFATVGVISQKSGVRFSNFKVTPAAAA